jgi:hypothetical protein
MKLGIPVTAILLFLFGWFIIDDVRAWYEYNTTIGSYWDLSVKASTLARKSEYLDSFVVAVDHAQLHGNNALFFPTPNNAVETNVASIKNLQERMHQVRDMDVTSFAYQQAISQITAQEQDDAGNVLNVIEGRWWLSHHWVYWDWIGILAYAVFIVGGIIVAAIAFAIGDDSW